MIDIKNTLYFILALAIFNQQKHQVNQYSGIFSFEQENLLDLLIV
jgi:hypothetical protein